MSLSILGPQSNRAHGALCSVRWDKPLRHRSTNLIRKEIHACAREASSNFRTIAGGPAAEATLSHSTTSTRIQNSQSASCAPSNPASRCCLVEKLLKVRREVLLVRQVERNFILPGGVNRSLQRRCFRIRILRRKLAFSSTREFNFPSTTGSWIVGWQSLR